MIKKILLKLFPVYRIVYHSFSTLLVNLYMTKLRFTLRSFGENNRIFFTNIVEPYNVSVGHHVYINKNCDLITTGSIIEIGNYVMIGPNTTLIAQNHDISDITKPMIFSKDYIRKKIIIKDDVWIGANVTVLAGVTIHKGSVIGAGSVVTKDVESYSIYAGIPARKIGDRVNPVEKKSSEQFNFSEFKNLKLDWNKWGVGDILQ